ncbi:hypothetical protein BB560_001399 [Smittium megazygosporum]|uniref:HpcH/HpaI aldolase/citrate lyase domain-containing protein n=1 Tax=Smittium megazygosporum TaxID=133381 RepID=A0A2T9ZHN4_9FUNG|nr:hypothetical protein BB560_001399 [Smittium megazygosporum]
MTLYPKIEKNPPGKPRIRRTLLFVDIHDPEIVKSSLSSDTDLVMYNLEDGVPIDKKTEVRNNILNILELERSTDSEIGVRVNCIGSGHEVDDLQTVLKSPKVEVLLIPKVESPSDIRYIENMIDLYGHPETKDKIRIIAAIETALAMANIKEIAQSSPRIDTLMFAVEDYCISTETTRSPGFPELYYARSLVANTAHAYGLESLDMINLSPDCGKDFKEECLQGYRMGFSGKQILYPEQSKIVFESFCPPPEIVNKAVGIIKDFRLKVSKGLESKLIEQKVAEIPYFVWSMRILRRAKIGGVDVESLLA